VSCQEQGTASLHGTLLVSSCLQCVYLASPPARVGSDVPCLDSWHICSVLGAQLNDNEGALQDCDAALEADEKYIKALIKRARLQIDLEMYEEAVKACEAACNLQQGDRGKASADHSIIPRIQTCRHKHAVLFRDCRTARSTLVLAIWCHASSRPYVWHLKPLRCHVRFLRPGAHAPRGSARVEEIQTKELLQNLGRIKGSSC